MDGSLILRASLAVALVSALAFVVTLGLRRRSASERHLVWAIALLVSGIAPILVATGSGWRLPVLPASGSVADTRSERTAVEPSPARAASSRGGGAPVSGDRGHAQIRDVGAVGVGSAGAFLYLTGVLVVLASLSAGHVRIRRVVGKADRARGIEPFDPSTGSGRAAVRLSARVTSPFTVGVLRPVVVLPEVARSWSRSSLRNALTHELAHVARHDWLLQTLSVFVCALHWFNPFVWFAHRRLVLEAERACDEAVLRAGGDAIAYAEQLVRIRCLASRGPLLGVPLGRGQLSERIRAIVDRNPGRPPMTRTRATLVTVGCFLAFGVASSIRLTTAASPQPAARHAGVVLLRAAARGDLDGVRTLLREGADVNEADSGFGTPLILAARGGHADVVDLLIENGADVNLAETGRPRADDLARTPLGAAAQSGALDVATRLLDAGAEVDRAPRGDATPLMMAAQMGSLPLVSFLLDRGADADRVVPGDGTPLIEAVRSAHPTIVARLLFAGADPNRAVSGDESPLYHAIHRGDADIVRQLVEAGVDVHARIDGEGLPLALAIERGDRDVIDVLLEAGALPGRGDR